MTPATRPQIARILHISERHVSRLAADGVLPHAHRGAYDLFPCVSGYIVYLQDALASKSTMGADGKLINTAAQRSELLGMELQLRRLEVAKKLGEAISIEDYEFDLSTLIIETRTNLLAVAPRVAAKIVGEMSRNVIERAIDAEIRLALTRLATATPAKLGRGPKSRRAAERKRAPKAEPRLGRGPKSIHPSGNAEPAPRPEPAA